MATRILIVGTGLIGASLGLALQALDPTLEIAGWDASPGELATALQRGAIDRACATAADVLLRDAADIYVLATPVLPILDWMQRLAPVLRPGQLVTDVGSTKAAICALAAGLFGGAGQAEFLAGHPMAGKEQGGAALADAGLFRGATWLFAPAVAPAIAANVATDNAANVAPENAAGSARQQQWRGLVAGIGAVVREMEPARHDELCAWVSHLPQLLATAVSALLQDEFAGPSARVSALPDALSMQDVQTIAGRALRETTRLGASPYSMWRDIALTNTEPIAATLLALEQRLAHLRENLRTPALRDEFALANRFRARD